VTGQSSFHIVTVGWEYPLVQALWDRIARKSGVRFSHILHPRYVTAQRPDFPRREDIHLLRDDVRDPMPAPDRELLASLEQPGVPTLNNMILGDPVVSKIDSEAAQGFATFLARRLRELFEQIGPSAIIGGFDCLHGSIALAVARRLEIPWYALNFSVIPSGLACFCDRMSPAGRVRFAESPAAGDHDFAERWLLSFESRSVQAPAYIPPQPLSIAGELANLRRRTQALVRIARNARLHKHLQFTEGRNRYSVRAVLRFFRRTAQARKAIAAYRAVERPPRTRYVLFGLHLQPESSIDVWAPFFANQMWVVELLSRAVPPTHQLLVKVHKSDISNYSREQLDRMTSFPGVRIVAPFADTRAFIEGADLVVTIQGTMGLEAALLGKPVIVLGDSPLVEFPQVARIGSLAGLPALVRRQLAAPAPPRGEIISAYAAYLAPFLPASHNDWTITVGDSEIDNYAQLIAGLRRHVQQVEITTRKASAS
jgi:hypothetical protein